MSNTDELEEDLRATFGRAAASVPPPSDLTARATTGAHQARRRTWAVSAAAAAGVAAVAVTAFALGGRTDQPTEPAGPPVAGPAAPQSTASAGTSVATVSGSWQPVRMDGAPNLKAPRPETPVLVLHADGSWTGSDGCNSLGGTYTIGPRGEFTAKIGPQRLIGCENVPHTDVLAQAKRVSKEADSLRFYAADGRELAAYARAR